MVTVLVFLSVLQSSSSKSGTTTTYQTRGSVQRLYGNPISEVYRTPQGLTATASFAPNGTLCRARVTSEDGGGITDAQLDPTLGELAPEASRGKYKIGTFLDHVCIKLGDSGKIEGDPCAECFGVSEDYERVTITKYGNTNKYSSVQVNFHIPECDRL
jgi:hypothetical protein